VPIFAAEQERVSTGVTKTHTGGEVCGQKTFTEVEDRPVVRERVERMVEHRPVEKQVGVVTVPMIAVLADLLAVSCCSQLHGMVPTGQLS
jgi:hypothetical protein